MAEKEPKRDAEAGRRKFVDASADHIRFIEPGDGKEKQSARAGKALKGRYGRGG